MQNSTHNDFPIGELSPDDTRMELSCGIAKTVLLYLTEEHGNHLADEILYSTRMSRSYLEDSSNWISLDYYNRLLERTVEVTGDPNAPFVIGGYAIRPSCCGIMGPLLMRLGTVGGVYALLAKLNHLLNRVAVWEHKRTGSSSCIIRVRSKLRQTRNNCLSVQGTMVHLSTLFDGPPATLRHPECICDGHPACVYELAWTEGPSHARALTGGLAGSALALAVSAYYGWEGLWPALGYSIATIAFLGGRIFDVSARLQKNQAHSEHLSSTLEGAMKVTEHLNEKLQTQVEERTDALRIANDDLKTAYSDLQESQARELAHQRNATVGVLASGMAHELNTPINTIQLAIQGILESPEKSKVQAELVTNARRAAQRCSRIVRELLTFSREPQTVSRMQLHKSLEAALSIFESEKTDGVTLIREFEKHPPIAYVDGAQIQQAILNLLNNASDAVENDGIITVRLQTGNKQAIVEVEDNGPGINEERQRQIFEPFESTKRNAGAGLGLGLSITSGLVKKNGGQIDVSSSPGEGACFSLHFPLVADAQVTAPSDARQKVISTILADWPSSDENKSPKASYKEEPRETELSADALRVLLIEDDEEAGCTLKLMMERQNLHVTHVLSAKQGIAAFDADRFDAVVTDVLIGDMTGLDVLRAIRLQNDSFPVILLTGYDSIGSAIEALRLGAQDYIQKPLERIEDLSAPVQTAVRHHRLQLESKRLTEELRASERRFRSLAELLPETVFKADRESRVTFMNETGMDRFGITQKMLNNEFYIHQLTSPEDAEAIRSILQRVLKGESVRGTELTGMCQGEEFPILTFSTPVHQGDDISGIWSIVVDISAQKESEKEVLHFQELLREMDSQLQLTQERERCNLASDLHDSVAQLLAAANMRITFVRGKENDPKLQSHLNDASEILIQAINQTRSLVFQLSPPTLYSQGLQAAIHDLAGHMLPLHNLHVAFTPTAAPLELNEKANIHIFRAVRELLTNVAKHAGVSECSVSVTHSEDTVYVTVEDDGAGFGSPPLERGPTHGGFGLFGTRMRLRAIGGNLIIKSEPGKGTAATVRVPLKESKQDNQSILISASD